MEILLWYSFGVLIKQKTNDFTAPAICTNRNKQARKIDITFIQRAAD